MLQQLQPAHRRARAAGPFVLPVALLAATTPATAQNLFRAPLPPAQAPSQAPAAPSSPAAPNTPPATPSPSPQQPSPRTPGPPPPPAPTAPVAAGGGLSLDAVSLFVVVPPPPKQYQKHDKIEIIVNETFATKFEGKLDTKKQYDLAAELRQFPSLAALLSQLELRNGVNGTTPQVGIGTTGDFKSSGTYERKDNLSARISALVLDVKPNGHLVIEATESIQSNEEVKTMVLSGIADPKDVTRNGTLQSSQLANLSIRVRHEGQVEDASRKGLIPRFFESVFNF